MGEHSKAGAVSAVGAVFAWIGKHKAKILAFAAGVVAAVTTAKPDFPGAAVMTALHAVLGV
ncbi:hypothetical protein QQY24_15705 [Streptomyces sp. TG1A-8]|uniref:hypothetical protein n=1 Tax=Streptomyces sp. TG1A-8 TaxID=3051385 RepID=UPI00265C894F|nr:hypothetical protein [Streptomyces sp. TG1A-8]MDO0926792.1 hypothetical protein [Streptomyces sp. TG1A-8]